MADIFSIALFVVGYILLMRYVLPRMGVMT